MSLTSDELGEWDLPYLKEVLLLQSIGEYKYWPYDVKFYPFLAVGSDPLFAVVSIHHVLIYRLCSNKGKSVELIRKIVDGDKGAGNCCLAWTKDAKTGAPLVCFAGADSKIKIVDARTGVLRKTLTGHGGGVNDLALSPVNLQLLASASADNTIRLWRLDITDREEPCVTLFGGEGHLDTILSISFHLTGRYILSSGHDHIINLWTVPELPEDAKKPIPIHSPHFSTSEVHSNIVDCVTFYGDLILSKAFGEDCIVLWLIKGFISTSPPPGPTPSNFNSQYRTRSAFSPRPSTPDGPKQYMRLLQFDVPDCEVFYQRFSLYSPLSAQVHPILAICNSYSKVFFWDLKRLEECHDFFEAANSTDQPISGPVWLSLTRRRKSRDSNRQGVSVAVTAKTASKYSISNPFEMIKAHQTQVFSNTEYTGEQVAWSACGEWCVVASTPNTIAVFQRWADVKGKRKVSV